MNNPLPPDLPLRDIHLPEPIGWWPPAPGWWIVLLLILFIILAASRWYFIKRKQRRLYRSAVNELKQIETDYQLHRDNLRLVQALSILLRRIAMTVTSRDQVAGLTGNDWLEFLDAGLNESLSGNSFSRGAGRSLIEAPYNPAADIDDSTLLEICRRWVVNVTTKKGTYHAAV